MTSPLDETTVGPAGAPSPNSQPGPAKPQAEAPPPPPTGPPPSAFALPPADRIAAGKALRDTVARTTHRRWKRPDKRADPIEILRADDATRLPDLVPIRYGRMLQSPFAFFRGSAAVMGSDLASTPTTGLKVQACGDCHLMNFGGFATPERNVIFDINDFDETLPAPWEWDIKRLTTSFVLAARSLGLPEDSGREAAMTCARSYRKRLAEFAEMHPLEVWYSRVTSDDFMACLPPRLRRRSEARLAKALATDGSEVEFPKLASQVGGQLRIHDAPPLIFHPPGDNGPEFHAMVESVFNGYRDTLSADRRALLNQYRGVDAAMKVVGIGSVGRRCWIFLLMSACNAPLFLQVKEAVASVLEPFAGASEYAHHGERVVMGQRLSQPASDMFLGWTTGPDGTPYYVRQLRDVKISPMIETFDDDMLRHYAKVCGWVLARAHAKAGGTTEVSGYLGAGDQFDEAMGDFGQSYADQAERDYAALKSAVRKGEVNAIRE